MLYKKNVNFILVFNLFIFLFISCTDVNQSEIDCDPDEVYPIPEKVDDGWETASLHEVGICPENINTLMRTLRGINNHYVHGIVVIKNNKLVVEEYFDGYTLGNQYRNYDRETVHFQASVTKSVTSALFGIAHDKNFVGSVDTKISVYYPNYRILYAGNRRNLSVEHLLTMSSGLDWDEWSFPYGDPRNDVTQLIHLDDPIEFILSKSMHAAPGEKFHYNSGITNVLGEIVRLTSGENLRVFAVEYLFEPLGIEDYYWEVLEQSGVVFASGGLHLRPRDMAKIGQLFLQKGVWNGERLLSEKWIEESIKESDAEFYNLWFSDFCWGYGYQWWLGTFSSKNLFAYFAAGWGDQYIIVIPGVEMVVVITGGAYYQGSPFSVYNFIVNDHIIPALY